MELFNNQWYRFSTASCPVYLSRHHAAWFVPDEAGDSILQELMTHPRPLRSPQELRFHQRLPDNRCQYYTGRAAHLNTVVLKELWFHITTACTMQCNHCLFATGTMDEKSLPARSILDLAAQASLMGCVVFVLTGGEPFVHSEIREIIAGLLSLPQARVVVLTNAENISLHLPVLTTQNSNRLHLQISIDGTEKSHESLRGEGSFAKLEHNLAMVRNHKIPFTLSMAVSRRNVQDMPAVVQYAAAMGASSVHFMWHFVRGRGSVHDFVEPKQIVPHFIEAALLSEKLSMPIDTLEALRSQIFSPQGIIHDGSGAAWESAAIGPDMKLYPSAATVGIDACATSIEGPLASVWQNSDILRSIRMSTIASSTHPWRFYTGGGDFDHSYLSEGLFTGADPYIELSTAMFLWLIEREASARPVRSSPSLRLCVGDILESCGQGAVVLTHSNCLLSLSADRHQLIKTFYTDAATHQNNDILNPICYPESEISHIPASYRFRGYGCGSPVLDAAITEGEVVVDCGSGRGIECFIAARKAGPSGRIIGIDMLAAMIASAQRGAQEVAQTLGFHTMSFLQGYLEALPLADASADVVLSNCVLNLSPHKRKMFAELHRILRPAGRIVVADVVCEEEPSAALRNNQQLKGECIAGALRQRDLCGLLEESGFVHIEFLKRFPYRELDGHRFFSLTFTARKPATAPLLRCMYRGPFAAAMTAQGAMATLGAVMMLPADTAAAAGPQLFILDNRGAVTNVPMTASCCCPPGQNASVPAPAPLSTDSAAGKRHRSGCIVCGGELHYLSAERNHTCYYCRRVMSSNALCTSGHFVCDQCHAAPVRDTIARICT
ncbi:MAG: methyltransferase domain-containing protein, partial [Chitinivibrionales bacterium]|nr:methyltransferase domain-containing protein [Chitinivibrionales bacterium]